MRKSILPFIILSAALLVQTPFCRAQQLPERYESSPAYMQEFFNGIVSDECEVIRETVGVGSYFGHIRNDRLFGWGSYQAEGGIQWTGMFRNGKCFFGILVRETTARVGSDDHFVEYDLESGSILRIMKGEESLPLGEGNASLTFGKQEYDGGDYYLGELKKGQRHGQGIYYWGNGNFWYGTFIDGYRNGYGALFVPLSNQIFYGLWLGDTMQ